MFFKIFLLIGLLFPSFYQQLRSEIHVLNPDLGPAVLFPRTSSVPPRSCVGSTFKMCHIFRDSSLIILCYSTLCNHRIWCSVAGQKIASRSLCQNNFCKQRIEAVSTENPPKYYYLIVLQFSVEWIVLWSLGSARSKNRGCYKNCVSCVRFLGAERIGPSLVIHFVSLFLHMHQPPVSPSWFSWLCWYKKSLADSEMLRSFVWAFPLGFLCPGYLFCPSIHLY
jgi:hypothetical protein